MHPFGTAGACGSGLLLVECDPTTKDADVVDDFKFAAPKGADDLAAVRKAYATSGRVIGEEVI